MRRMSPLVRNEKKDVFVGMNSAAALTGVNPEAGGVELAHIKLHSDDGKHDDSEEEQQANLQERNHGFHDGLQHHLEA